MRDLYLTDQQYLDVLKRQLTLIENGAIATSEDCDDIGAKHTSFSWGLCSDERETWPSAELHLFPDDFRRSGRIAPKYLTGKQPCPLDTRTAEDRKTDLNGCYYTCAYFQSGKLRKKHKQDYVPLTRETVAQKYRDQISVVELRA